MFLHFSLGTYELAFLFVIDQPAEITVNIVIYNKMFM